jgi:hypothetical protein
MTDHRIESCTDDTDRRSFCVTNKRRSTTTTLFHLCPQHTTPITPNSTSNDVSPQHTRLRHGVHTIHQITNNRARSHRHGKRPTIRRKPRVYCDQTQRTTASRAHPPISDHHLRSRPHLHILPQTRLIHLEFHPVRLGDHPDHCRPESPDGHRQPPMELAARNCRGEWRIKRYRRFDREPTGRARDHGRSPRREAAGANDDLAAQKCIILPKPTRRPRRRTSPKSHG